MVAKNYRSAKFDDKKKNQRTVSNRNEYSGNVPTNVPAFENVMELEKELKRSSTNIKSFFDHGKDMTPKHLFTGARHFRADQMEGKLTDLDKEAEFNESLFGAKSTERNGSIGSGLFSRRESVARNSISLGRNSIFGRSTIFGRSILDSDMRRMSVKNRSLLSDDFHDWRAESVQGDSLLSYLSLSTKDSEEEELDNTTQEPPTLSDEELKKLIEYDLTETDTLITFKIIGTAVGESDHLEAAIEQNSRYEDVLKEAGPGNEKYVHRPMLTFNNALKTKETATNNVGAIEKSVEASISDIWDAFNILNEGDMEDEGFDGDFIRNPSRLEQANSISDKPSNITNSGEVSSGSFGLSSVGTPVARRPKIVDKNDIKVKHDVILSSPDLQSKLLLMERIVSQNTHQSQLGRYRDLTPLDPNGKQFCDDTDKPDFERGLVSLWSFQCHILKGFNVNSIAFNRSNPDIIAVGYGHSQRAKGASTYPGIVCVWSTRNLEHPERVFQLPDSVTACDFSMGSPNLLAVGLANGTILVYNITRGQDKPIVDSVDSESKHLGVVWSLKWIERETGADEKTEVLVSTSGDGRVVQWTIRKGFESVTLIKVNRHATFKKLKKDRKSENTLKTLSQLAPATAFSFHPTDGNTYLVGTEEGVIHRCSCSYNEQTLESYVGHKSQVYSVAWHPTIPGIFISSSEDWSLRLWNQGRSEEPIASIQSSQKPVHCVQWSPYAPNVAASISADTVNIWDFAVSTLDPVFSLPITSNHFLTSLAFSPVSNSIFVGDSDGSVAIFQLKGFKASKDQDLIDHIQSIIGSKL